MRCSKCGELGHNARTCVRRQAQLKEEDPLENLSQSSIDKDCAICCCAIHRAGDNFGLPCCGNVLHTKCYEDFLRSCEKTFVDGLGVTQTVESHICPLCKADMDAAVQKEEETLKIFGFDAQPFNEFEETQPVAAAAAMPLPPGDEDEIGQCQKCISHLNKRMKLTEENETLKEEIVNLKEQVQKLEAKLSDIRNIVN